MNLFFRRYNTLLEHLRYYYVHSIYSQSQLNSFLLYDTTVFLQSQHSSLLNSRKFSFFNGGLKNRVYYRRKKNFIHVWLYYIIFLVDAKKKTKKNHRVKPIRTGELRIYKILYYVVFTMKSDIFFLFYYRVK